MTMLARLIFAAPMSGSGKTTITAGIIAALVARGYNVAPFKCGPDYIDPTYHTLAAKRPSHNLDSWLTPPHLIPARLSQRAIYGEVDADIAIIEGVMGLFDGYAGDAADEEADIGSTAHIARITESPVVIILDVRGMARTAAAIVAGLRSFDPRLNVAGVILNRVGSARHAEMVKQAIESTTKIPVLGYLLRDEALSLPERHLGLVPTSEDGAWQQWLDGVRAQVEHSVDLDSLLTLATTAPPLPQADISTFAFPPPREPKPTIAVARDHAFSFHYEENLDMLMAAGANIAYFSPLHDNALPPSTHAIYLCGGFPELYADVLSNNTTMLKAIRQCASEGTPIYAECGGLMYLSEAVMTNDTISNEAKTYPMVGLLKGTAVMKARVTLGYRIVQAHSNSWLWRAGESARGHEFHYSLLENAADDLRSLYEVQPSAHIPNKRNEGVQAGNVLASYIHLHFLAMPHLASRFVEAARAQMKHKSESSHS